MPIPFPAGRLVVFAALLAALCACEAQPLRSREAGALGGGALGAGLGAIIGNQVGNQGAAIAIGGALGAVSGALIGNEFDNRQGELDQNEARIVEQDRRLEENRRLIEELKRRGTDVRSTERGVVVNLPDVLFEFDRSALTSEARRTVGDIAEVLRTAPGRSVSIEGHTDSTGTISYNQRLSEERARSVARELNDRGVSRGRISTRGFGETEPIASNATAAGRQRNRRVEVIIEN